MPRVEVNRTVIQRMLRAVPFHPFALSLENGDRLVVDHPENYAFDAAAQEGERGWDDFHAVSNGLWVYSTFGAVTSAVQIDRGDSAA